MQELIITWHKRQGYYYKFAEKRIVAEEYIV
jgi:hypothetical protein